MNSFVTIHHDGKAALITIRRADKRNALSRELIAELTVAFMKARDDAAVRAVILTGEGPAFCAGMDLGELQESLGATKETIREDAVRLASLFDLIYTLPKPTIAAVNGSAVAGGAGLVTACDLAVSVPSAKFGYPEVRRGLVAAIVMPHLLRLVGERAARQLLLAGELIAAPEALRLGLLNEITEPESLMAAAKRLASQCADGGPMALANTKRLLAALARPAVTQEELAEESANPRLGHECRAGLEAFFRQQPPPWA
ncbi:enoyl-CoA hydratase-related protein [Zavarzinella formosa]|uniref:enoyl-CoA hydratase-related protein n=1 Tax=Zavarzinella formosa TaxID=360055 RepID=UPI0002DE72FB|nr:enoyl-CoA hydratase-related protein [Zavarzinella formosa]